MRSYHTHLQSSKRHDGLSEVLSLGDETRRLGSSQLIQVAEVLKSAEARLVRGERVPREELLALVSFVRCHTEPSPDSESGPGKAIEPTPVEVNARG